MLGLVLTLGFIGVFFAGTVTGAIIARYRTRSETYFQQSIENARTQGRIEGMQGKTNPRGLEPPAPLL